MEFEPRTRVQERFAEMDLSLSLKSDSPRLDADLDDTSSCRMGSRHSDASMILLCVSPHPESDTVDINSNLTSPSNLTEKDEDPEYDRQRRRSSRLSSLKSELIESGATFRPPFTPSNSLSRAPKDWQPKEHFAQTLDAPPSPPSRSSSRMRSASVRPGSQASSAGSSRQREPSLPPIRNKYAHVKSRIDSHSNYKAPPSQVKILNKPVKVQAQSRVGSLANIQHVAKGGEKRIPTQKLDFRSKAQPKIDFGKGKENGTLSTENSRPPSNASAHTPRSSARSSLMRNSPASQNLQSQENGRT